MSTNLIYELKAIERMPNYVDVDKTKVHLEVFEEWKNRNSLVDRVIRGETSFSAEFGIAAQKLDGVKPLIPHYVGDSFRQGIQELEEAIGIFSRHDFFNIVNNPISMGAMGVIPAWFVENHIERRDKEKQYLDMKRRISRRAFTVGVLGAFGASGGLYQAVLNYDSFSRARENAAYLDTKIKELYRR